MDDNKEEVDLNNIIANKQDEDTSHIKNEERIIWDLEIWKRAEQSKFKAYLKQLEYEFINKVSEEYKAKEDLRENEFKLKINELNVLQTKLKKKVIELESRENKVCLMEEELKIKINEIARQLANKEEEIQFIKKRAKEDLMLLEKSKSNINKQLQEKINELNENELEFKKYKKYIEDSPFSVLKEEISRKCLEIEETNKDKLRLVAEKEKYKVQCEKLKLDLIKIKKLFEEEKEQLFKQKMDEMVFIL